MALEFCRDQGCRKRGPGGFCVAGFFLFSVEFSSEMVRHRHRRLQPSGRDLTLTLLALPCSDECLIMEFLASKRIPVSLMKQINFAHLHHWYPLLGRLAQRSPAIYGRSSKIYAPFSGCTEPPHCPKDIFPMTAKSIQEECPRASAGDHGEHPDDSKDRVLTAWKSDSLGKSLEAGTMARVRSLDGNRLRFRKSNDSPETFRPAHNGNSRSSRR